VGGRASGRLLEKARVALEKEDVVEEVEAEGPEVEEGGDETPVLCWSQLVCGACIDAMRTWLR
jgi:hypothetical protein